MKKLFIFIILLIIPITVNAENITSSSTILVNDNVDNSLIDNNEHTYKSFLPDTVIKITNDIKIDGLYIVYERNSTKGIINNLQNIGENNILHEYIKINEPANELIIKYYDSVSIADIYVFSEGDLPEFVEVWNTPLEKADIMLLSSHSDDEHLFFLGLLPKYIAEGADVQVVSFTNHYDNTKRLHEQLHGLYAVGVRNYPIFGIVPDAWSTTLDGALKNINKASLSEDDLIKFQVQMIRRFKPQVIVSHDEAGEYGHGQHILCTYILEKAYLLANDNTYDLESINQYGLHLVNKIYLHLYKENPIVLDYDTPLDYFNGKIAYEMSKIGYSKHLSQQWTWFTGWINGSKNEYTKSTDIKTYIPNNYGLYYTNVGEDINKNDILENITLYKNQKKEFPIINLLNNLVQYINKRISKINLKAIYSKYSKYIIIGFIVIVLIIIFSCIKKRKSK